MPPTYLCLAFMNGTCRNVSCVNYHPLDTAQFQIAKQEISKKASDSMPMSKICINFNNGTCKFNPCKFIHVKNHYHALGQLHTTSTDIILSELAMSMRSLQQKIHNAELSGIGLTELTQLKESYMKIFRDLIDSINDNVSKC